MAKTITGDDGSVPAAKLKIMGVDVFSAGDFSESTPGNDIVRFEDAALGTYKKLILRDNRLVGVILVGDAVDSYRYVDWLQSKSDLRQHRRQLLFPQPAADAGLDIAQLPDTKVICGCHGVSKASIVHAIRDRGLTTLAQVKECTRASTGCGTCTDLCQQLLKAVAPQFHEEEKKALCKCIPISEDQLREIVRSQRLRSVQ